VITREQLEADKALCEKATEGPWVGHTQKDGPCIWSVIRAGRKWVTQAGGFTRACGDESEEHYGVVMSADDLAFSTRARTALPEYIAELEATRECIEQVEYVDLAAYLHNHDMPCTVEALATRRLLLGVLRATTCPLHRLQEFAEARKAQPSPIPQTRKEVVTKPEFREMRELLEEADRHYLAAKGRLEAMARAYEEAVHAEMRWPK